MGLVGFGAFRGSRSGNVCTRYPRKGKSQMVEIQKIEM
jgi:hypothetical protein